MKIEIKDELDKIVDAIKSSTEVEEIYLFGSHAKGFENEESDFDIYVVIPDNSIRPLLASQKIRQSILPFQKRPIDLLVCNRSKFLSRKASSSFVEKEVALNGIKLYG